MKFVAPLPDVRLPTPPTRLQPGSVRASHERLTPRFMEVVDASESGFR
jgi:hypothetical protein